MPSRPKKPCAYPGCPNRTDGRYCEKHTMKVNSDYEKYGRNKNTKQRYGRAWKRIHDKYAAEHPFCERCYEHGVLVPTEETHHKLLLSEGGKHDCSNQIALCTYMRSVETGGDKGPAKPASWGEGEIFTACSPGERRLDQTCKIAQWNMVASH